MVSLHVDINRRLVRCEEQRPASFADLIMVNKILHKNIKIPLVKDTTIRHKKRGDASEEELKQLMLDKNVISNDILESSYLNAVALISNVGMELTDEEKDYLVNNKNNDETHIGRYPQKGQPLGEYGKR